MKNQIVLLVMGIVLTTLISCTVTHELPPPSVNQNVLTMGSVDNTDTLAAKLSFYRPDDKNQFIKPYGKGSMRMVYLFCNLEFKSTSSNLPENYFPKAFLAVSVDGVTPSRKSRVRFDITTASNINFVVDSKKIQKLKITFDYKGGAHLQKYFYIDWVKMDIFPFNEDKNQRNMFTKTK